MEKKRSLKLLIVSACLALLLVSIGGIIAGANEPVKVNDNLVIKGASLDLNDKISIAFAVKADAIGYEKNKELQYAVEIYDTNPGTKAGNGTLVTYHVVKTIGGEEYVLFITDGFTAPNYKNTVYARLVGNGEYGPVVKTGVLEMANRQLAGYNEKLAAATDDDTKDYYNTRVKLYSAIINYGINADLVVSQQTKYNYSFITVADGYIVDDAGSKWTTGVYANGTKLNLEANVPTDVKLYTIGADVYGWSDGASAAPGNVFTVRNNSTISPVFSQSTVDVNPVTTQWALASNGTVANYNWNALSTALANSADPSAVWGYANGTNKQIKVTRNVYINENGEPVIKYVYDHKNYVLDGKYTDTEALAELAKNHSDVFGTSGYGIMENPQQFRYSNPLTATANPYTMSFDLFFPGTDKNGNGEKYDAGVYVQEVLEKTGEDDEGNPVYKTTYKTYNGDMYTTDTGSFLLRMPI